MKHDDAIYEQAERIVSYMIAIQQMWCKNMCKHDACDMDCQLAFGILARKFAEGLNHDS